MEIVEFRVKTGQTLSGAKCPSVVAFKDEYFGGPFIVTAFHHVNEEQPYKWLSWAVPLLECPSLDFIT